MYKHVHTVICSRRTKLYIYTSPARFILIYEAIYTLHPLHVRRCNRNDHFVPSDEKYCFNITLDKTKISWTASLEIAIHIINMHRKTLNKVTCQLHKLRLLLHQIFGTDKCTMKPIRNPSRQSHCSHLLHA
jgi:hypothetical protein